MKKVVIPVEASHEAGGHVDLYRFNTPFGVGKVKVEHFDDDGQHLQLMQLSAAHQMLNDLRALGYRIKGKLPTLASQVTTKPPPQRGGPVRMIVSYPLPDDASFVPIDERLDSICRKHNGVWTDSGAGFGIRDIAFTFPARSLAEGAARRVGELVGVTVAVREDQ
jgi:hypothetical protein